MPVTITVRKDALERAKEAIALLEQGVPVSDACRRAGTTLGTVRKVLKVLKIKTRIRKTRHGRKRVIVDAKKIEKAQCVVRLMQYKGLSATQACKECHTKIGTIRAVMLDNCRTLRRFRGRYQLQVYEVNNLSAVFYGRLRNKGSAIAITHTSPITADLPRGKGRRDDYASIMWQYDFDVFLTTLSPEDVCNYYMQPVFDYLWDNLVEARESKTLEDWFTKFDSKGLDYMVNQHMISKEDAEDIVAGRKSYSVSPIEELFRVGTILDDRETRCGIDDRKVTSQFICKRSLREQRLDVGKFQVLVLRKGGRYAYPAVPKKIPYPHGLLEERRWRRDEV